MEQALSRDILVPLGLGVAALVVVVLIVVLVRASGRGSGRATAGSGESTEPTAADWTGEAVESDVRRDPEGRATERTPRRLTVADAVARRSADTAPLPVSSETLVARARARKDAAEGDGAPAVSEGSAVTPAPAGDAGPAPAAGMSGSPSASEATTEPAAPVDHPAPGPGGGAGGPVQASAPAASRPSSPEPAATPSPRDAVAPPDERPGRRLLAGLPEGSAFPGAERVGDWYGTATSGPTAPAAVAADETSSRAQPAVRTPEEDRVAEASGEDRAAGAPGEERAADVVSPGERGAVTTGGPVAPTDRPAPSEGSASADGLTAPSEDPAAPSERPTTEPARAAGPPAARRGQPEDAGTSRKVAEAVQQALAARARLAQAGPDLRRTPEPAAGTAVGRRGDARDRLLAVLLSDPELALGATAELDGHQEDLARLNEAVRRRTEELADVVRRLADAGLAPEQVARLAELSPAEVTQMLQQTRRS